MDCERDETKPGFVCKFCEWVYRGKAENPRHNCPGFPAKSRGLGDSIAKVTAKLGVKKCGGCGKRQVALNKMVPYGGGHDADAG